MDKIREDFRTDWEKKFASEPLPSLRFLATKDHEELLEALSSDELDLKKAEQRLKAELERVSFNYGWVLKKKQDVITAANEAGGGEEYANVDNYLNEGTGRPVPRPRVLSRNNTTPSLPVMPPLPGKTAAGLRSPSVKRTSSLQNRRKLEKAANPNSQVSEEQCRTLSTKISKDYKQFGKDILGFTPTEIDKFQQMSAEAHKQAMRMLLKWKQRLGRNATVSSLTGYLKDFGFPPDVWGFLEDPEKYSPINNPLHKAAGSPDFEPYQTSIVNGYITSTPDELSVKKGDVITVQAKGRDSWIFGEVDGICGWVPGYCVNKEPKATNGTSAGTSQLLFVVETISNSSCADEGFVSFIQNELLDVLEELILLQKRCYRVRNSDGWIGLALQRDCRKVYRKISVLCDREWYFPGLSRYKTEDLLGPCPQGTFLIRDASKAPGNFVLCVKSGDEIASFMMTTNKNGYKVYDGEFRSIQEAIDFYQSHVIRDRLILIHPAPKNSYYEIDD